MFGYFAFFLVLPLPVWFGGYYQCRRQKIILGWA